METTNLAISEVRNGLLRYNYNPFLDQPIPARPKREYLESKHRDLRVTREGSDSDPIEVTHMTTYKKVDSEEFIKSYDAGWQMLFDLSKAAMAVMRQVKTQMQANIGKDKIHLSFQSMPTGTISQATYSRGLKELIEKGMLAPVLNQPSLWWTNPKYFFNGDRLKITVVYDKVDAAEQPKSEDALSEAA